MKDGAAPRDGAIDDSEKEGAGRSEDIDLVDDSEKEVKDDEETRAGSSEVIDLGDGSEKEVKGDDETDSDNKVMVALSMRRGGSGRTPVVGSSTIRSTTGVQKPVGTKNPAPVRRPMADGFR